MAHVRHILIMCISFSSIFGVAIEKVTTSDLSQQKESEKLSSSDLVQKEAATKTEEKRKITVNNTIVKKDLGYYKCWMTHYPSEFNVHVNGKKLDSKEQLVVDESRLNVVYSYEWSSPFGTVKKSKTLVYDVDHKTAKVDLSFTSWKEDEPRIKAPGCTLVTVTEVEEANTIPKEHMSQIIAQVGNGK